MISPKKASSKVLNMQKVTQDLEAYIDRILMIGMSAGESEIIVALHGYEYTLAKYALLSTLVIYERDWVVEDITGNRTYMYVLRFTPKGNF